MTESREDLEARIAAYIDGQLPAPEAARLEVFLANTDPQLAEQIIGMLGDRHRLRTLPRPAAPPDLAARVLEQVERSTLLDDVEHFSHPARPWWQSRAAIAAGFILVIGGFAALVALSVLGPSHTEKWGGPTASTNPKPLGPVALLQPGEAGKNGPGAPAPTPAVVAEDDLANGRRAAISKGGAVDDRESQKRAGLAALDQKPNSTLASAAALESADKSENVVQEQLAHSRDLAQNGPANASKMGYTTVNSAFRALGNISVGNSTTTPEPVVITLVARDDQDFARLRLALETLLNQDPAAAKYQAALQSRYLANFTNGANDAPTFGKNFDNNLNRNTNNNQVAGNAVQTTGNAAAASQPTALNGQALADNAGYNFYDAKRKEFQYVPEGNATVPNAAAPPNAKAGDATTTTTVAQPQAAQHATTQNLDGGLARQQATAQTQRPPVGWETGVTPLYRVALRTEQLRQLASQFQVDSITSGHQAYVIVPDPSDNALALAHKDSARYDADRSYKETPAPAPALRGATKSAAPAATPPDTAMLPVIPAPAASPAPPATTESIHDVQSLTKSIPSPDTTQKLEMEKASAASAPPEPPATAAQSSPAPLWLECIITMEPRPARPNNDNPPEPLPSR